MAPQGGSGGGGSSKEKEDEPDYTNVKDAKELLDKIGQQVYKEKVEKEAETYKDDLKGHLNKATNRSSELSSSLDPCSSDYTTHFYANSERNPCRKDANESDVNRFSDTLGGQCTDSKMRSGGKGACAPLRRLHVCVRNLENINDVKEIDTKDNLLLEVCMAAYYEGQSIKDDHAQYQSKNVDFKTHICTELARSFADIGDIIRGKDLFRGYNEIDREQKKKLYTNI
ncbi:hypothetical protein PFUGPA_02143 [Plasmodium falciparum Palo Alto/Uganda]|uniref:Uncharacterized protein n=1 Tax=Plasmodium falciparum (isolate Palo Alto / Uganda) TaxID=57270 RepID=W4J0K8_PLAFP|nr:hypothetical protein PFUGPA_02143 [Plasmodium falciparum Palo Alto/Uganda]